MIRLSAARKQFGSKSLFEDLDWLVTSTDRVGLVGGNGSGKTTLLKILGSMEPLDGGLFSAPKDLTSGYLPQDGLSLSGSTVLEECLSVFGDLLELEEEMKALTRRMAEVDPRCDEYQRISDRYHRIETEFQGREGYSLEAQAGTVLNGLGFAPADLKRPTEELSGGWQMRLALAKLLLIKPRLLLLDEPTNHLDLEARNWLQQYLSEYPYAFVLVSHDRYMLDATVNRILELWNRRAYFYVGNYERYLAQKSARQAQLQAAYRNQREKIERLEVFINRFRYQATRAKQVQSRIKELEKIKRIELPAEERTIRFAFPQPTRSGSMVAEFRGVAKSYAGNRVFQGMSFVINRGDRIGLVGVNGAGKSTLIKILAGSEPATAGEFRLGHNVKVDHFAQDQYKELDPEARLIDDVSSIAPDALSGQTQLRTLLGCFLFSSDEVFKQIRVLSGGERNRYALLRMLLRPRNFLLLDEPTNHLDLRAKDVLLEALQEFTGTVVFVSHDRYFIDKLATRIFELEGGRFQDYLGNYEDYLRQKNPVTLQRDDRAEPPRAENSGGAGDRRGTPLRQKKINPVLVRKMKERHQGLEEEITRCETEIATQESDLGTFKSAGESIRLVKLVEHNRKRLDELIKEWEELSRTLEESDGNSSVLRS
ncbi:MAG: ABC-F family ATP-binding cassette domain-containing protein [Acidobacteriota bacterium]|nr:ABC-F family ATP-binding cassette domain-containing protein [Acidobacteriota bacterium]